MDTDRDTASFASGSGAKRRDAPSRTATVTVGSRLNGPHLAPRPTPEAPTFEPGSLCAREEGFSRHARVHIDAHDRERLVHLCRYIARLAIATERLTLPHDGRLVFRVFSRGTHSRTSRCRSRWPDSTNCRAATA
ncbi:MAG: hypothetical protein ACI8QZ_004122 [Chlamydiales bacterium]|jgi:hypothetical protein